MYFIYTTNHSFAQICSPKNCWSNPQVILARPKVDQKSTPSTFHFSHEGHQLSVTILVQTSANCPPSIWPGASKETKDDPKERKETKEDNI